MSIEFDDFAIPVTTHPGFQFDFATAGPLTPDEVLHRLTGKDRDGNVVLDEHDQPIEHAGWELVQQIHAVGWMPMPIVKVAGPPLPPEERMMVGISWTNWMCTIYTPLGTTVFCFIDLGREYPDPTLTNVEWIVAQATEEGSQAEFMTEVGGIWENDAVKIVQGIAGTFGNLTTYQRGWLTMGLPTAPYGGGYRIRSAATDWGATLHTKGEASTDGNSFDIKVVTDASQRLRIYIVDNGNDMQNGDPEDDGYSDGGDQQYLAGPFGVFDGNAVHAIANPHQLVLLNSAGTYAWILSNPWIPDEFWDVEVPIINYLFVAWRFSTSSAPNATSQFVANVNGDHGVRMRIGWSVTALAGQRLNVLAYAVSPMLFPDAKRSPMRYNAWVSARPTDAYPDWPLMGKFWESFLLSQQGAVGNPAHDYGYVEGQRYRCLRTWGGWSPGSFWIAETLPPEE